MSPSYLQATSRPNKRAVISENSICVQLLFSSLLKVLQVSLWANSQNTLWPQFLEILLDLSLIHHWFRDSHWSRTKYWTISLNSDTPFSKHIDALLTVFRREISLKPVLWKWEYFVHFVKMMIYFLQNTHPMIWLTAKTGIATGDNELDKQCGYIREADSCLRNFTRRCTTPTQRELISLVTEGSQRLMKEYCTKGSKLRQSYLKHATCLNQATRGQKGCIKDLQAAFEVITSVEWDKRIPAGCCAYKQLTKCTETLIESKCGKEAVDFTKTLLRMALSRLPDIVCQGHGPQTNTCKAILPPPGTPPKGSRSSSVLSRLFSAYTGL